MEPAVVDTYSSLVARFANGFVLHVVTVHQGFVVNPVNQVSATLIILVLVIVENYLERQIKRISEPRLALLRDVLLTIFMFLGFFLAYLLIALIDGFFADELSAEFTLSSFFRPVVLVVSLSLLITLLRFTAGELKIEDKPAKQKA